MKRVDACEQNPVEAIRTNINGTVNVIDAAVDAGVGKVLGLSSDKACSPTNLYGATKLVAEKLLVDANVYSGRGGPAFFCTRWGNVAYSRGSVLGVFEAQHAAGLPLSITNGGMTRFALTLQEAVQFALDALEVAVGGEVLVPRLSSVSVETVARSVTWPSRPNFEVVGLRPGEKMHELLISGDEASRTLDRGWHFLVTPPVEVADRDWGGERVPPGWVYSSESAPRLNMPEFRVLAGLGVDSAAVPGAPSVASSTPGG